MQDHYYQEHPGQQTYVAEPPQEPQIDPVMERVLRKMVRLLLVSIGVMIIGLMAVLAAVVYKINASPDADQLETAASAAELAKTEAKPEDLLPLVESQLELTPGTRLLSQSLSGNLVSLETLLPDGGTEIMIYDYRQSRFVGRMRLGNLE